MYTAFDSADTANSILRCQFNKSGRQIKKLPLNGVIRGENKVVLSFEYTNAFELEDIYITGDFAVDGNGVIIKEPKELRFGDWTLQGYPNYPGAIEYMMSFESGGEEADIVLGEWRGILAAVTVNGSKSVLISNSGSTVHAMLKSGKNDVSIEIVGSNRNIFGPLHNRYTGRCRISWEDFRTEGADMSEREVLEPCGLMGQVKVLKARE